MPELPILFLPSLCFFPLTSVMKILQLRTQDTLTPQPLKERIRVSLECAQFRFIHHELHTPVLLK